MNLTEYLAKAIDKRSIWKAIRQYQSAQFTETDTLAGRNTRRRLQQDSFIQPHATTWQTVANRMDERSSLNILVIHESMAPGRSGSLDSLGSCAQRCSDARAVLRSLNPRTEFIQDDRRVQGQQGNHIPLTIIEETLEDSRFGCFFIVRLPDWRDSALSWVGNEVHKGERERSCSDCSTII